MCTFGHTKCKLTGDRSAHRNPTRRSGATPKRQRAANLTASLSQLYELMYPLLPSATSKVEGSFGLSSGMVNILQPPNMWDISDQTVVDLCMSRKKRLLVRISSGNLHVNVQVRCKTTTKVTFLRSYGMRFHPGIDCSRRNRERKPAVDDPSRRQTPKRSHLALHAGSNQQSELISLTTTKHAPD